MTLLSFERLEMVYIPRTAHSTSNTTFYFINAHSHSYLKWLSSTVQMLNLARLGKIHLLIASHLPMRRVEWVDFDLVELPSTDLLLEENIQFPST